VHEELTYALGVRSSDSELALLILLKMAKDGRGLKFLAKHRQWMYAAKDWPLATFRVFLVVFRTFKRMLADDPTFGFLLKAALETRDLEVLDVVPAIINQSPVTVRVLKNLSQSGFIRHCRVAAVQRGRMSGFLSVLNGIASVGFVPDFLASLHVVLSAVNVPDLSLRALDVLVKLSQYNRCAQVLQQVGFSAYCETLQSYPQWASAAGKLLSTLSRNAQGQGT
jgi:hypothetical protein